MKRECFIFFFYFSLFIEKPRPKNRGQKIKLKFIAVLNCLRLSRDYGEMPLNINKLQKKKIWMP